MVILIRKGSLSSVIGIEFTALRRLQCFYLFAFFLISCISQKNNLHFSQILKVLLKNAIASLITSSTLGSDKVLTEMAYFSKFLTYNLVFVVYNNKMSKLIRIISVFLIICMQAVISQTQYCFASIPFELIKFAKRSSLTKKLINREAEQSIEIQIKVNLAVNDESKTNHLKVVEDKWNYDASSPSLAGELIWNQYDIDQQKKHFSSNLDEKQQLKLLLAYPLAAFLIILSINCPINLQKINFYLFALLYLLMSGAAAQPSTMTPICSNCPACYVPNTCFYFCNFGYYYSGICYFYTNMPGCTGANGRYCISCNPNYYLSASSICTPCSSTILNCQSCSSSSVCSLCISGYTVNSTSYTCDSCPLSISNCATCSSKFICTGCVDQIFFLNSTYKCQLCSSKKSGCLQCTPTTCISCVNTAYILIGSACLTCGSIFPFCVNCTTTVCQICDSMFFLNANLSCQCKRGSLVDNECIDVAGCQAAIKFKNRSFCTQCDQSIFKFNTSTLLCDCKIGFLLNYHCSVLYGCITMILVESRQTCLMCNKSRHFVVNNTECSCDFGYYLNENDNTCYQTCGDGILLHLQCDDGNLVDGDGCTSKCTVERSFICSGGNQTTPTQCLKQIQNFKLEVEEIQNVGEYNIGKFEFRIVNYDEFLYTLNWTQVFYLEIDKKHKVNSISLTDNKVTFIVEYFEDLEGFSAIFHLNLDPEHFLYPKIISLPFEMVSQTAPLVLAEYPNETILDVLSDVLFALSLLGFILLFVAPCYHKMIALETLTVLQFCNLAPFLIKGDSLVIRVFSNLQLSNGFGRSLLSDFTTFQTYGSIFEHMSLPKTFTENMLINECILIVVVMSFIIAFYVKDYIDNKDSNSRNIKKKMHHYVDVYCWNLVFSTTMGFFLFFFIALNCNNHRVYEITYSGKLYESTKDYIVANSSLNSISIFVVLGFIASVGFVNIFTFFTKSEILNLCSSKIIQIICKQFKRLKVKNKVYVVLFLVNLFVSYGLLACLCFIDSQNKVFAYFLVSTPYALTVFIYRPYTCMTDNLGICLGQITPIIFLVGLCIKQYFRIIKTPLNLLYEFYFCIGIVCLLTVFVSTSMVRLAFQWYNDRFQKKPTNQRKRKKSDTRKPTYQKVDILFNCQEKKSQFINLLNFQQVIKVDNPDLLKQQGKLRNNLQEKRSMIRNTAKNISDAFDPIRETLFKNNDNLV